MDQYSENTMDFQQLKLDNQLCFPLYAVSRLITREYQPYLDELGITYPQYLVLMVLWEHKRKAVNDIAKTLILKTNTITPLIKRMEALGLVARERSTEDRRTVHITLTEKGESLRLKAVAIPDKMACRIIDGPFSTEELIKLKDDMTRLMKYLAERSFI